MYKIYNDNTLIYDSALEDYVITKGLVTKETNKSGSFVFTIYSSNPYYNAIHKMKSIIRVYKGDKLIFRGRPIKEVLGFYKDKTFTCEGELGFLLDSIMRPYSFTGTPEELLRLFIDVHNSQVEEDKRFTVGTVTVTDPNDYIVRSNESYESVSTNLFDKLIETLGGYLFVEDNNGERVINWYADSPYRSGQSIEFGENLLSFTKTNGAEDIATAIIPLGYEIENETTGEKTRLTIAEVNNGLDYIYDADAVNLYGWIFKTETWDDVTIASNLKSKGEAFLREKIKQSITIELSAIDLSLMDKSIDSFELGYYIHILSGPHNLDDDYLLEKQTIDLLKPDNDKITLGYSYKSFTDKTASYNNRNNTLAQKVETIERDYVNYGIAFYESAGSTDANTTIEELFISATNTPTADFWYVQQSFYSTKASTTNRMQYAIPYGKINKSHYRRNYVSGAWSEWIEIPVIIEEGTLGIWSYKKWSDRRAEVIGKINQYNININTVLGSWYRSASIDGNKYPYPFTFGTIDNISMQFVTTNNNGALVWLTSSGSLNDPPYCYLIRPTSATGVTGAIHVRVEGTF